MFILDSTRETRTPTMERIVGWSRRWAFGLRGRSAARRSGGFTLVELIVVVVILSVLAGAIAPRLLSGGSRAAEADVRAVAGLLSAAGRRDALTSQRIAIDYDAEKATFRMLLLADAGVGGRAGEVEWIDDRLTLPAELKSASLLRATADGADLDPARWRVEFRQASLRPGLELKFGVLGGDAILWTVSLPSGAFGASVRSGDATEFVEEATRIDLDLTGKAEEAW